MATAMMSVVVPVYGNAGTIAPLLASLLDLSERLGGELEVVFVVDGSPDNSGDLLRLGLSNGRLRAQLLLLSRNFGAFAAIRAGLEAARGERFSVLAADLQEPPELILDFDRHLRSGECDIVVGTRTSRADPLLSRFASSLFWRAYRLFVQREIPPGGVDVFGCSKQVRDHILALRESNSSLVGLLFWVGFRRQVVPYARRARAVGRSAWTFTKKLRYLSDSVFNFTDLPVRLLFRIGIFGTLISVAAGGLILGAKLTGRIAVPGYTATTLIVVFFGALNCLGLGIIGGYVWRTLENTKERPNFVVASRNSFGVDTSDVILPTSAGDRRDPAGR
jgi:glycosyltransferase involved in cell wall biosynthesis